MESNKKNNSNGGDEHQPLRRSMRKRKLNELPNDGHGKPAAEKEEHQQPTEKCRKNEHGKKHNDSEDLQLEGLSREDLIKLVKKKVADQNETQKQLRTTKKEAEESASKQAQEFSQRIVQLDQEKAELHKDLNKKSAEIVEMHKEMEKNSRMIAEKTDECNALLIQLNDSRREQIALPMDQEMKIRDPTVWRGTFVWSKQIQFECSMRAISNQGAWKAGAELLTTIHVMGKSESECVWDYVRKQRSSWNKQVILAVIEPAPNNIKQYQQCYDKINIYSHSQEIAVLDVQVQGHEQIKDGYLISVAPNEPLPKILLPLEGPGLPDWCKQKGCIVVMLIRRMDSEDKLWRESLHTMPACNIQLEAVGPENRDPRLDGNVTKQSKIYKLHTQMVEDDQQGFPCVESVADVLDAIQLIDTPGKIINFVGNYIETHPELTDEQRKVIANAILAKAAEVKRQQKMTTIE